MAAVTPFTQLVIDDRVLNLLKTDLTEITIAIHGTGHLRTLMERLRDNVVRPSITANFAAGGRLPNKWPAITPDTMSRRKNKGTSSPLVDTGGLAKSAQAKARFHIRDNKMYYGAWPQRYYFAPYHQAGGPLLPRRDWLDFFTRKDEVDHLTSDTGEWLEEIVRSKLRSRYI